MTRKSPGSENEIEECVFLEYNVARTSFSGQVRKNLWKSKNTHWDVLHYSLYHIKRGNGVWFWLFVSPDSGTLEEGDLNISI